MWMKWDPTGLWELYKEKRKAEHTHLNILNGWLNQGAKQYKNNWSKKWKPSNTFKKI